MNKYDQLRETLAAYAASVHVSTINGNSHLFTLQDVLQIVVDAAYKDEETADTFLFALIGIIQEKDPEIAGAMDRIYYKRQRTKINERLGEKD